jgi:hypothetical protein
MKVSKRTNRICLGLAIAALVAIFMYQIAYGMTMGPNGTMSITSGNISATLTAPPGSKVNNFTIVPGGNTSYGNTSYAYPPPTITYSLEPGNNPDCSNCYFQTFTIHEGPYVGVGI